MADIQCTLAQFVIHERSQSLCAKGHGYIDPTLTESLKDDKKAQERYKDMLIDVLEYGVEDTDRVVQEILEVEECPACHNRQRILEEAYEALGTSNMSRFC